MELSSLAENMTAERDEYRTIARLREQSLNEMQCELQRMSEDFESELATLKAQYQIQIMQHEQHAEEAQKQCSELQQALEEAEAEHRQLQKDIERERVASSALWQERVEDEVCKRNQLARSAQEENDFLRIALEQANFKCHVTEQEVELKERQLQEQYEALLHNLERQNVELQDDLEAEKRESRQHIEEIQGEMAAQQQRNDEEIARMIESMKAELTRDAAAKVQKVVGTARKIVAETKRELAEARQMMAAFPAQAALEAQQALARLIGAGVRDQDLNRTLAESCSASQGAQADVKQASVASSSQDTQV